MPAEKKKAVQVLLVSILQQADKMPIVSMMRDADKKHLDRLHSPTGMPILDVPLRFPLMPWRHTFLPCLPTAFHLVLTADGGHQWPQRWLDMVTSRI
jgi:hypothetical protein